MAGKFLYDNASNTPAKYRFSLLNPESNELRILKTEPLEWESGEIEIKRDINVGGVFTSFTSDSLTFVKEGASFLRGIWDEKEINGRCTLIVEYFDRSDFTYKEMPSRFSLNFATARPRVKVGNKSIGFEVEATKEDILVKLENRRNKEIDISKIETANNRFTSVGGAQLSGYSNLRKLLRFGSLFLNFQTIWTAQYINEGRVNNNKDYHIYTTFNMSFNSNDFAETNEMQWQTNLQTVASVPYFFSASTEAREMIFYYFFGIEVTNRKGGFLNAKNVYATFIEVVASDGEIKLSERIQDIGKKEKTYYADGSLELSLEVGDSVRIFVRTDDTGGIDAYIRSSQFRLVQNLVEPISQREIESVPIYESFERLLQHISDTQFPFYSEFFGRTDVIYNNNGDKYISENQLRFANLMSGLHMRGAKLFDKDAPLALKFDDLYDSANAIWNIGYEVEYRDLFTRIRVENYDYFFEDIEVLDLSGRISRYDIESEVMPELAYSLIKAGFKDYSYEVINGRGEFNTDSSRTSVINTDTVLDIVSPIRGDSMGIFQKLSEELTTEDTEEDNELFIIKTQSSGTKWVPEKEQNITIDENSSLFGDDSYNLYFTPSRMLKRHGNRIKGAFSKYLQTFLRFQKSTKKQTLKTTGEGYTITENDDILVNDLAEPIYKPIKHVVECTFTFEDLQTLMTTPKGYIKFSDDISGYLLSLKKRNNEDKAIIEIIEKV